MINLSFPHSFFHLLGKRRRGERKRGGVHHLHKPRSNVHIPSTRPPLPLLLSPRGLTTLLRSPTETGGLAYNVPVTVSLLWDFKSAATVSLKKTPLIIWVFPCQQWHDWNLLLQWRNILKVFLLVVLELQLTHDEKKMTQVGNTTNLRVPDKCPLLMGHGWARVPPQTQCTTTSAVERGKEKKWQEEVWKVKKSQRDKMLKSQRTLFQQHFLIGEHWKVEEESKPSPKQPRNSTRISGNHAPKHARRQMRTRIAQILVPPTSLDFT